VAEQGPPFERADVMDEPVAGDRLSGLREMWGLTIVRVTAIVGAAAVLLAVGAVVWAATWNVKSDPPPALAEEPAQTPSPTPTPTGGPGRPAEPVEEQPPAPDTIAPAIPVVQSPAEAILTNDPRPVFSGLGEPGAELHLQLVDPVDGFGRTIAATIVGADGRWSLAPAAPLVDGRHALLILQVDAAGNVSDAARRSIGIDTVALPPTIAPPPTEPQVLLPAVEGTGEPSALVTVRDERGATVGVAEVGADGRWRLALTDPGRDGMTLAATQTDGAGNVSSPSARTTPLVFARADLTAPAEVASTGGSTPVAFTVTGPAGSVVEVAVDGVATGQRITLTGSAVAATTAGLADGVHTLSVRYIDGSRVGVWATVTVTIVAAPDPSPTPTDSPTPSATPTDAPTVAPTEGPAEE
jgi:large repetitive protein